MDDDKPLTPLDRLAAADRDAKGKFIKGHKPSGGRPKGALGLITKSLREEILDGIGNIPTLIRELKQNSLPACAGLPSKLIPPADEADPIGGGVVNFVIAPIRSGTWMPRVEIERRPDPRPSGLRLVIDRADPAA
jgi:hypothetical protein